MLGRGKKASDRLERALQGGPVPHNEETRLLLATAGTLAPVGGRDPQRIKATHDAMMASFMRTLNPVETREDAGSSDGLDETELHRHEAEMPDGGTVVLSNLEEITPEMLEETRRALDEIIEGKSKDRQS